MEKFYQTMLSNIRKHPLLQKIIMGFTRYIPIITFIVYSILLVYLLYTQNTLLAKTLYKPLARVIREKGLDDVINRKSPCDAMVIFPSIEHREGETFPSRHTVSAFAIALACLQVNSLLGTIMLILAFVVSCSRILSGVHYISDVLSAVIIALIISFL